VSQEFKCPHCKESFSVYSNREVQEAIDAKTQAEERNNIFRGKVRAAFERAGVVFVDRDMSRPIEGETPNSIQERRIGFPVGITKTWWDDSYDEATYRDPDAMDHVAKAVADGFRQELKKANKRPDSYRPLPCHHPTGAHYWHVSVDGASARLITTYQMHKARWIVTLDAQWDPMYFANTVPFNGVGDTLWKAEVALNDRLAAAAEVMAPRKAVEPEDPFMKLWREKE
jgi:hypothetical protein